MTGVIRSWMFYKNQRCRCQCIKEVSISESAVNILPTWLGYYQKCSIYKEPTRGLNGKLLLKNNSTYSNHLITSKQKITSILENVMDPEVPVLSVMDLGIVREI